MGWVLVVPVKRAVRGKSRLTGALADGSRMALARAMALDTVEAAVATPGVELVVVVTGDAVVAAELGGTPGVRVLAEPEAVAGRDGLNTAIEAGLDEAVRLRPGAAVGVLLGDLPMLLPHELAAALRAAAGWPRSVVVDAQGTGTTLLAGAPGVRLHPRFGAGSAQAHTAAGHVRLAVPARAGLRRDVDEPVDLARLAAAPVVGRRTRAVLRGEPSSDG